MNCVLSYIQFLDQCIAEVQVPAKKCDLRARLPGLVPKAEAAAEKLEVDLTQENVISVALWIHLVPGSGPPLFAMV